MSSGQPDDPKPPASGPKRARWLIVAALVVLAGAVIALSLGGGSHKQKHRAVAAASERGSGPGAAAAGRAHEAVHGALTTAAQYLGVSRQTLRAEQRAGLSLAEIAESTAGRSASGLVEAIAAPRLRVIREQLAAGAIRPARATIMQAKAQRLAETRVYRASGAGSTAGETRAIEHYLGITPAKLDHERLAGRSLSELAAATPGRSTAGLVAALESYDRSRIEAQLASRAISPATAQRIESALPALVQAQVTRPGSTAER